jgi:hypothetical protein
MLDRRQVEAAFAAEGIEFEFVSPEPSRERDVLLVDQSEEELELNATIFKSPAAAQRYLSRAEAAAKRYSPGLRKVFRRVRIGNVLVFYSSKAPAAPRADAAVETLRRARG